MQMRKAGVESQTQRDIMGHESTSMDDRYTMIDDEALEDARQIAVWSAQQTQSSGSKNYGQRSNASKSPLNKRSLARSRILPESPPISPD
jgi:hypothetical protein